MFFKINIFIFLKGFVSVLFALLIVAGLAGTFLVWHGEGEQFYLPLLESLVQYKNDVLFGPLIPSLPGLAKGLLMVVFGLIIPTLASVLFVKVSNRLERSFQRIANREKEKMVQRLTAEKMKEYYSKKWTGGNK